MKDHKKKISNLVFVIILVLFFIPNTRGMMQIFLTRIFSFSPSLVAVDERVQVTSYDQWKLHGVNTSSIDFSTAKDKVVIINYWATWCPPCIAEMPSFQNLYDAYKDKVVFLFVTNEVDDDIFKFMNAKKFTYPVYRSLGNDPVQFSKSPIPVTYVLDKKGNIVVDKVGAADWDTNTVKELVDRLVAE